MRRWLLPVLVTLLVAPLVAMATGTLTTPNIIGAQPRGNVSASLLDTNWTTHANYINAREITQDVAANRPAAGVKGRWYFATDANGGTLYSDTGSSWTQVAPPVQGALAQQYTGLTLSNDGTAPGTTVDVAVGAATSDDATITNRVLMILASAFTKTTGSWTAGTGVGCLDTGTVAASTWYHVFLIQRTDTNNVDLLCSTSATAPTMPTNYTKKRRIGSVLTDANGAINFFSQVSRSFRWATPSALNVSEVALTAAKTASATTPNGVVVNARLQTCLSLGSGSANILYVSALTQADIAPSTTATPLATLGTGTNDQGCGLVDVYTDTSRQYRIRGSAIAGGSDAVRIVTVGWEDTF